MELNESSYALKPDLFRVEKAPDITMWIAGVNDGLQELATYNPPGPTQPGMLNKVSSKSDNSGLKPAFVDMKLWIVLTCAEKWDCFAKHQPGVAACGRLQPGRNFTQLSAIYFAQPCTIELNVTHILKSTKTCFRSELSTFKYI